MHQILCYLCLHLGSLFDKFGNGCSLIVCMLCELYSIAVSPILLLPVLVSVKVIS